MADPITAEPEEIRAPAGPPLIGEAQSGALALLRRPQFRRLYLAVATSELGDAFQYIALMWAALLAAGPVGVIVVRLADSVPALLFGFHGGVLADRASRRRLDGDRRPSAGGRARPGRDRRAERAPAALGARRLGLPAHDRRELLRPGLRRRPAGARGPRRRAGRERARPGERRRALARRLGGRRGSADGRPAERVLCPQRGLVRDLGAPALRPAVVRARRARARGAPAGARGVHGAAAASLARRLRSSCSASR